MRDSRAEVQSGRLAPTITSPGTWLAIPSDMNATLPVSQTPIASDLAQSSATGAANSVNSGGKGQDFAAALSNAGPRPVRKAAGAKATDAGTVGGHLPAAGNLSPPPTPPPAPPLTTGSAAAAAAAAAATATTGTVGAPIPGAGVGTAAPAAVLGAQAVAADQNSGTAPIDLPVAAPGGAHGATSPGAGFGLALGLPVDHAGEAGAPGGDRAAAPGSVTAVAVPGDVALAKGAARAAVAVASTAQARAAAGTAAGAANKPGTVATTAAVDAAVSRPTAASRAADGSAPPAIPSSTTPSTSAGASTNTDANAQAVTTAAAMSAAATGTVAPGDTGTAGGADLSALPTNDSATPATAAKAPGTAGPNGPPVPAPAPVISVARPATEVSAKGAAAAPVGTALAGTVAADKRASGGTGDSLLSGTSVDGSAGAAQLSVNPTAVADATTAPPTLKVAAGVETPEFGHGLADRVSWMVDNNLNGAKLQVNPPQLGPIEVRIAVQGSHAQVWLASHSAVTRDALESSSSKLREMLGAQGFGQVSVDISQRSYQDRSAHPQPYESMPSAGRSQSTAAVQSTASSLARISSSAVDAYA